ncbi:MAG TPA: DUF2281 domain-containing protein [Blastocatellia bacterium]|nr:DUF2281 domain-containing protein [Blastocatellia bacterium]
MTAEQIEQTVLQKFRALPPERQQEALDFVEFLEQKSAPRGSRRSLCSLLGAFAHLGIHVSEEDIAEVRREMWAGKEVT